MATNINGNTAWDGETLSTILDHYINETVTGYFFDKSPFLGYLIKNGGVKLIDYANPYVYKGAYVGADATSTDINLTNPTQANVGLFTPKHYLKNLSMIYSINRQDRLLNQSKYEIFDTIEQKHNAALGGMCNAMNKMIIADGTGNNGKDLDGLELMVSQTPMTYAEVDPTVIPAWDNLRFNATTDFAMDTNPMDETNTIQKIKITIDRMINNGRKPKLALIADDIWEFLDYQANSSATLNREAIAPELANLGFSEYTYQGVKFVRYSGAINSPQTGSGSLGLPSSLPAGTVYILDTDGFKILKVRDTKNETRSANASRKQTRFQGSNDFIVTSSLIDYVLTNGQIFRKDYTNNDEAYIAKMVFTGNLICTDRSAQAVLFNPTVTPPDGE